MFGLLNTEWVELDLKLPVNNDGHCSLTAASANVYLVHNTCDSSRVSRRGDGCNLGGHDSCVAWVCLYAH